MIFLSSTLPTSLYPEGHRVWRYIHANAHPNRPGRSRWNCLGVRNAHVYMCLCASVHICALVVRTLHYNRIHIHTNSFLMRAMWRLCIDAHFAEPVFQFTRWLCLAYPQKKKNSRHHSLNNTHHGDNIKKRSHSSFWNICCFFYFLISKNKT